MVNLKKTYYERLEKASKHHKQHPLMDIADIKKRTSNINIFNACNCMFKAFFDFIEINLRL